MKRDEIISKFVDDLTDKTGHYGYDGFIEFPESGNSFKLVINPVPGRRTAPRDTVIHDVLNVVKSHFPSDCVTSRESNGDYPHGSYIITVSDYTRYHD